MKLSQLSMTKTSSGNHSNRNTNSLFGGFEPKTLNLLEECAIHYPNRQWSELNAKEQTELIRKALQSDAILLNPHSEYIKYWDLVVAVALLFTSCVTPYEVVFTYKVSIDSWLFWVNRLIDLLFVKDMCMQFFLRVEIRRKDKQGTTMLKDPKEIRLRYLRTWFLIDFVSILPFDIFFVVYRNAHSLQGIKIFRMARLFRLVKLVRILRSSRLIIRWQNHFAINFSFQKLLKFGFMLVISSHWMACLWGLTGLTLGKDLCDADGFRMFQEEELKLNERSWVTQLFNDGKYSPDDPCDSWHVYITALYWSVMTITSIGYGDIFPVRNEEYMVCVACMLLGGVLWAYIIGSLCGVMANGDPVESQFEANMDLLNMMMSDARVDRSQRQKYREYLREAKVYDQQNHFREIAQSFSPMLKGTLLTHVSTFSTLSISYLKNCPEACIAQMLDTMEIRFYSRKEKLHDVSNQLCLIERGTLARSGKILTPGMAFQVDFIVTNPALRRPDITVSLTYSLINTLARDAFTDIVSQFPAVVADVKKAAVKLALMRVVFLCAELKRLREARKKQKESKQDWVSLIQAFRTLQTSELPMGLLPSERSGVIREQHGEAGGDMVLDASRNKAVDKLEFMQSVGSGDGEEADVLGEVTGRVSGDLPHVLDAGESLDEVEAALVASVSAAQSQLADMQMQLEELRNLRLQVTI